VLATIEASANPCQSKRSKGKTGLRPVISEVEENLGGFSFGSKYLFWKNEKYPRGRFGERWLPFPLAQVAFLPLERFDW
jgi:hypothetical protein